MRKSIVTVALIFLISTFVSGRVIATFPELLNPDRMEMDENRIYITEGIAINIYSFKDFRLIRKFGKKGEGPREFARYIGISLNNNRIYVNSQGKLSIYSVDGEFIKEMKTHSSLTGGFIPIGKFFIGRGMEIGKESNTSILINLYDSELKKQRNIIKKLNDNSFAKGVIKFFDSTLNYNVIGNKLYVVNGTDFKIDVYDSDAKKILSIQRA
ncbi:MAG: 6-bladed beta-propeller, partial [Candidatus Aminicenantes bacterium]|nr:6-bladed beta-propeller [Candidatus Aminicenantes bacterium]